MTLLVLSLAAAAFGLSVPLTWLAIRSGRRLSALDSPGSPGHAKTLRAVPNTGGIAIVISVLGPIAAGLAVIGMVGDATLAEWAPPLAGHLDRLRDTVPVAWALVACAAVVHVLGVIDDRRGLGPLVKLAVEVLVAVVMVVWFDVRLLTLLGPAASIAVTVAWIVAVTNAINFLDNMDGLAGGVSAVAGSLLAAACLVNHQWFIAATLALLVGAIAGFLVFNFPPARVFMGDGGSLAIGFMLGVLTARTTYYSAEPDYPLGGGWYAVFMPLVILAIPLYDLASVTLIRIAQGKSPLVGDQQHFSHRLVQRGLSPRGAVVFIWAATAATGVPALFLGRLAGWQAVLVGVETLTVLGMLALLEYASRRAGAGGDP